jgi:hypothetical protein
MIGPFRQKLRREGKGAAKHHEPSFATISFAYVGTCDGLYKADRAAIVF